jgi:hypothetical protein
MSPIVFADSFENYLAFVSDDVRRNPDFALQVSGLLAALRRTPEGLEIRAQEPRGLVGFLFALRACRSLADQIQTSNPSLARRIVAHANGVIRALPQPARRPTPPVRTIPQPPTSDASPDQFIDAPTFGAEVQGPMPARQSRSQIAPACFHTLHRERIDREDQRRRSPRRERLEQISGAEAEAEIRDSIFLERD